MKRCPQCNRVETDDALAFCRADGTRLIVETEQIYAGLGDNEQALAWLDKACNERAVWIPFLKVDLKFDPLRSNPSFQGVAEESRLFSVTSKKKE